jgi:hypothetical protein
VGPNARVYGAKIGRWFSPDPQFTGSPGANRERSFELRPTLMLLIVPFCSGILAGEKPATIVSRSSRQRVPMVNADHRAPGISLRVLSSLS